MRGKALPLLAALLLGAGGEPARPQLSVAGKVVDGVNVAEAARPGFAAEIILPKPEGGAAVTKWNVVAYDFEADAIVWSKSGEGAPPERVPWDYRLKDGSLPKAGGRLGLRVSFTGEGGTKTSPVSSLPVTERRALFLEIERREVLFLGNTRGYGRRSEASDRSNSERGQFPSGDSGTRRPHRLTPRAPQEQRDAADGDGGQEHDGERPRRQVGHARRQGRTSTMARNASFCW